MLHIQNVFLVLALCAAPTLAHTTSDEARATTDKAHATDTKENEARRILHLASGQAIRVVSRWKDDAWQYRSKDAWKSLDPRMVVSVALEKDTLAEWNERRAAVNTANLEERAKLAAWAATAGLATEALVELDGILSIEPDHVGALEILGSHWFFTVPSADVPPDRAAAARADIVKLGSSLVGAAQEVVLHELGKFADKDQLRASLVTDLTNTNVARRRFAAHGLHRLFRGQEVRPLMIHAVLDSNEDVRREAALALRAANDPALVAPMLKAFDSKSVVVRTQAAEALGHMGYAAAVEPLVARLAAAAHSSSDARPPHAYAFFGTQTAYVQDFDVEVAQFQAVADPVINVFIEGNVLDAGVIGEHDETLVMEAPAIRQSLEKLTQAKPGHTTRQWLAWWEKNGDKWRSSAPATHG